MLVDNERSKLAEYEKEYQQLLKEWKKNLPSRKAVSFFLILFFMYTLPLFPLFF